jgi:Cellulase (glycosyl hydrolase family 5)
MKDPAQRSSSARAARHALFLSALALGLALAACGGGGNGNPSSETGQWSVFEDHSALVRATPVRRERTLRELQALGADTLRIEAKWNELAPAPLGRRRPSFDAADPGAYPGFGPYDDLVRRAASKGFRILLTLAPEAPRWATAGGQGKSPERANLRPLPAEFAKFAGAVAKRYSGAYRDLPKVEWFSVWNEPNHMLFLKPLAEAPAIYRQLVGAAVPAIRDNGAQDVKVLVGETAPSARAGTSIGPAEFIRKWLCLDAAFQPIDTGDCTDFQKLDVDGYAHHPYGAVDQVPPGDVVNLLAIRRLGALLDRAAAAGRLPEGLPIYDTEFGLQSNPPDPTVSTTLEQQAELINEKEEFSHGYARLRSYAQYLLYDDPVRPGPPKAAWSGFQTGLRFANGGARKPSWNAYRLPIVVHAAGTGVRIWGRVRPGNGSRTVQLERPRGSTFATSGDRVHTDEGGYFTATRPDQANYRYRAFDARGNPIGTSRVATPVP